MRLGCLMCVLSLYMAYTHGEMLDMTYSFDENAIHWPGGQSDFHLTMLHKGPLQGDLWVQNDEITSGIHVGTHMDAPRHFSATGWTVEQIPIDRLVARPAVMIDIRQKAALSPDVNVTLDDVMQYESSFGEIPTGAVIVQCSGWGDKYSNEASYMGNDVGDVTKYHFPGFGVESVKWLVENRGIYGLAVDVASIDYGMSQNFATHVYFCANNLWALENVKDTCKLPPSGSRMHVLPSKIVEGSGGHTRVVAFWGDAISHAASTRTFSLIPILHAITLLASVIY